MIELWPRLVFGPYTMKRFGKPLTMIPRNASAPSRHASARSRPSRPRTLTGARNSCASNPVP